MYEIYLKAASCDKCKAEDFSENYYVFFNAENWNFANDIIIIEKCCYYMYMWQAKLQCSAYIISTFCSVNKIIFWKIFNLTLLHEAKHVTNETFLRLHFLLQHHVFFNNFFCNPFNTFSHLNKISKVCKWNISVNSCCYPTSLVLGNVLHNNHHFNGFIWNPCHSLDCHITKWDVH